MAFSASQDSWGVSFQQTQNEPSCRAESPVERHGADDGLEGPGEHAVSTPRPRPLALPQIQVRSKIDLPCPAHQRFGAHEGNPPSSQLSFIGVRIEVVQIFGCDRPQDRVTEELETLVGQCRRTCRRYTRAGDLVQDRAMSQGGPQESKVPKSEMECPRQPCRIVRSCGAG